MRTLPLAILLSLAAAPAFAHLDPGEHGSFLAGVTHPLFGADHVLAMIAVGLWGAVIGGQARLWLPTAFVGAMVVGFGLALGGIPLPFVEPMILASVLLLGLAVALWWQLPMAAAAGLVALAGLAHGHAHGGELGEAGALAFGAGFVLATAALHGVGLLLAWGAWRGQERIVRGMGAVVALAGLWVAAG